MMTPQILENSWKKWGKRCNVHNTPDFESQLYFSKEKPQDSGVLRIFCGKCGISANIGPRGLRFCPKMETKINK